MHNSTIKERIGKKLVCAGLNKKNYIFDFTSEGCIPLSHKTICEQAFLYDTAFYLTENDKTEQKNVVRLLSAALGLTSPGKWSASNASVAPDQTLTNHGRQ